MGSIGLKKLSVRGELAGRPLVVPACTRGLPGRVRFRRRVQNAKSADVVERDQG